MQNHAAPVLVVGAGAAGTTLALELARQGVAARLIDRLPAPSTQSRAITVHARTLELLELTDPELAERFLQRGLRCPGYVMRYVDPRGVRQVLDPGLDFRGLSSRYNFLMLHPQHQTEAVLRDWLRERHGRTPEWGVECTGVRDVDGNLQATLRHRSGHTEQVDCRYLVACDGAGSTIRGQVGLAQEGTDYAGTVLQNLDVELPDFPGEGGWVHYCMGPAHFLMVAPLPGSVFRLLMSQPADAADTEATPQAVFAEVLGRHFDGLKMGRVGWHSRWASRVRLAHHYRRGNVFLAGDAAHVHSTAGGQGMNCCMHDAWNIGWKLGSVLRGEAPESLLDSYESERKPIGGQVIGAASSMHELFMAGRSGGPEALTKLRVSGELDALIGRVSGIAYHYRHAESSGCGLRAGDRLPNLQLLHDNREQWLYRLIAPRGSTRIVALPHAGADLLQPGDARAVVLAPAPPPLVPDGKARAYVVRPDGYLGAVESLERAAS